MIKEKTRAYLSGSECKRYRDFLKTHRIEEDKFPHYLKIWGKSKDEARRKAVRYLIGKGIPQILAEKIIERSKIVEDPDKKVY
ncbi:hypothetical protein J7K43_01495 [Candidatus Calescamantes bacterium]|nr:hypothetical protein [Candidatus Calescamantes bacterium]